MRSMAMLLWACTVVSGALAQEAPATTAVDRTDPRAVTSAYADACRAGDIEAVLALLVADQDIKDYLREMTRDAAPDVRKTVGRVMLTEIGLRPDGDSGDLQVVDARGEGATTTITARETAPREIHLVLARDADGRWAIDLSATTMATQRSSWAYLVLRVQERVRARAREAVDRGRPRSADYWQRHNALRALAFGLIRMTEITGKFPEAATWTDDMAAHYLDPAVVQPLLEWGDKHGFALNAGVAGKFLPAQEDRESIVMLYETSIGGGNQSGDPNEALARLPQDSEGLLVAFADGQVALVPPGMTLQTLQAIAQTRELADTCRYRVATLCGALLAYAKDHGSRLPAADEWCDAIGMYLPPEEAGPEAFICPAAPDLDCGYAINADLAGKDIRQLRNHGQYCLLIPSAEGVRNEARRVPEAVDVGRHTPQWSEGRLSVVVGMLDATATMLSEGQPYPGPRPLSETP